MTHSLRLLVVPGLAGCTTAVGIRRALVARAPRAALRSRRSAPPLLRAGSRWPVAGAVALAVAALAVWPVVALGGLASVGAGGWLVARRRRQRARRQVDDALPDLVDLFVVAASAGLPAVATLAAVAPRAPPSVAAPVHRAASLVAAGAPASAAFEALARDLEGRVGQELAGALSDAAREGTPLAGQLRTVAATARHLRRKRAEERARRLPVTLLFPLTCCVLPAVVLLAVVPVLASSFADLAG